MVIISDHKGLMLMLGWGTDSGAGWPATSSSCYIFHVNTLGSRTKRSKAWPQRTKNTRKSYKGKGSLVANLSPKMYFNPITHRIHGTGIFTYTFGWFLYHPCIGKYTVRPMDAMMGFGTLKPTTFKWMENGDFEPYSSRKSFGFLHRFFTKNFVRYLKWRVSWTLYPAILGVGFPLHKPYPYSLYRWGWTLHFRYLPEKFGEFSSRIAMGH